MVRILYHWSSSDILERYHRNHGSTDMIKTDRGVEKSQILEGLSDKEIEETVTGLVKADQ